MPLKLLEQRLAALEKEVAHLKEALSNGHGTKNWERTVGMFSGDDMMKRIDEHARQFREKDRRDFLKAPGLRTEKWLA